MNELKKISGFYGSGGTPCTILVYFTGGAAWYCVEDGLNVNLTYNLDLIEDGLNVENHDLNDVDCFMVNNPVQSLDELQKLVDE